MWIVSKTPYQFDIEAIRSEVNHLINLFPDYQKLSRISLRHRAGLEEKDPIRLLEDGCVALAEKNFPKPVPVEADFSILNPLIKNSYLGEIFEFFEERIPCALGRYRILRLKPRTSTSWHHDEELRFHIPVYTQTGCYFLANGRTHSMMEPGRAYAVRTDVFHSAVNASGEDRIHLVLTTSRKDISAPLKYWLKTRVQKSIFVRRRHREDSFSSVPSP